MPPSTDVDVANKQSLMSLGHLSAVAIAKDTRNHQILAQTPAHLHKVIWRAYLTDKYYINFTHNVTSLMKLKEVDPRLEVCSDLMNYLSCCTLGNAGCPSGVRLRRTIFPNYC